MQTRLISGITPLPNDNDIAAILARLPWPEEDRGRMMVIAILGTDDRPYRVVVTNGESDYFVVTAALESIGFTRVWGAVDGVDVMRIAGGVYDVVFSLP